MCVISAKPCPKCGVQYPNVYRVALSGFRGYYVGCLNCFNYGAIRRTRRGAVKAWNKEVKQ